MNKNSLTIKKMALAAIFLVFGWILPLVTGRIPEIGNMLCPMHIPVMLCGFILGPWYGLIIGFITPLTRGFIFGMPTFYPTGISMAFELATYGLITGILYELLLKKSKIKHFVILYFILISSMLAGRIVWGIARVLCGLFDHHLFTWRMFLMGGFVTAWPGIIIQLIVIPILLEVLFQTKILEKLSVNYTNKSLKQILKKVKALMKKQDQLVIAIDGMAASGKTTLANEIAKKLDANIIHTDDFYLPSHLRTDERLNQLCCNIDYERLQSEVLEHINEHILYHKFDCKQMQQTEEFRLDYKKILIIEGAYSMHPILGKYYDLSIYLKTPSTKQEERILNRDGMMQLIKFKENWIPLERQYFDKYRIEKQADIVIHE